MAHGLGLGKARQADGGLAFEPAEARRDVGRLRDVDARRLQPSDFKEQGLFLIEAAIAGEGLAKLFVRIGWTVEHQSDSFSAVTKSERSSGVLVSVLATTRRSSRPAPGRSRETGKPASTPFAAIFSTS